MKLRQLKKDLQKQHQKLAKKNRGRRWLWGLLLLTVLAALGGPLYRVYRQNAPQRLLQSGEDLARSGAAIAALEKYQQLYRDYPDSPLAPEALLRSGRTWHLARHQERHALLTFLQLEHDYPTSRQIHAAREEAAHILKHALRDYSGAIEVYQRLLDSMPDRTDQYLFEIADCYFRLDNYTQARIELETLLEVAPESPLLPEVLYRKGGLLLLEKHPAAAREDWERLVAEFPDSRNVLHARFNLAKLLEEEGRLAEALEQYRQLTDYPQAELLKEKIDHLQQRMKTKKKAI
jgi:TolA-binding protein